MTTTKLQLDGRHIYRMGWVGPTYQGYRLLTPAEASELRRNADRLVERIEDHEVDVALQGATAPEGQGAPAYSDLLAELYTWANRELRHLVVRDDLTAAQIRALRDEAGVAGDLAQVRVCDRALAGDLDARDECARVIRDAAAMAAE